MHNISQCFSFYWLILLQTKLLADKLDEAKFVTEGFNDWKKAIVRSDLYKEAILKVQYLEQPGINVLKQPTLGNFGSLKR